MTPPSWKYDFWGTDIMPWERPAAVEPEAPPETDKATCPLCGYQVMSTDPLTYGTFVECGCARYVAKVQKEQPRSWWQRWRGRLLP